jgi:hypothetical protein
MSTTFGILTSGGDIELENDCLPLSSKNEDYFEVVAIRRNNGSLVWMNVLAKFLPANTKVYPLDNSAQGIYTIGDVIEYKKTK